MPLKRRVDPSGQTVFVRRKFEPDDYTVPTDEIETILSWGYENIHGLLDNPEGPLQGRWLIIDRTDHDGKKWLVLQHVQEEWCLEVEDSYRPLAEVGLRPLPPERAWDLALAEDAKHQRRIERAGW